MEEDMVKMLRKYIMSTPKDILQVLITSNRWSELSRKFSHGSPEIMTEKNQAMHSH